MLYDLKVFNHIPNDRILHSTPNQVDTMSDKRTENVHQLYALLYEYILPIL
jgi:hypothetical protein